MVSFELRVHITKFGSRESSNQIIFVNELYIWNLRYSYSLVSNVEHIILLLTSILRYHLKFLNLLIIYFIDCIIINKFI